MKQIKMVNGKHWVVESLTSSRMNELVGGQYGDMMNQQPQVVPSSDPMSQFLNKDYSEVLEKSIEKSKTKIRKIIMGLKQDLIKA